MNRIRALAAVTLALLFVATGCSRSGARFGTPGEIRIVQRGDVWTLNPLIAFSQRLIDLTQIYAQPLVGVGPDNRPLAVLCTEVPTASNGGISRDARTITYHLRDVKFADGVPFTSKDVLFTYRAIMDPHNPVTEAAPYHRIASVETPDAHTVVIHLKAPWSAAPEELFAASDYIYGILPEHAFHGNTDVRHAAWNEKPFGTGPFMVTQWKRGERVVMEANPYAWQPPKAKRLIFKIVGDENAALVALQAHEADFADVTADQVARLRGASDIALLPVPRNESDELELQTQGEAMRDHRMREAVAYAIDRAALARTVYHGFSQVATTEIPPIFPEHDASIAGRPYDPEGARALVAASGYQGDVQIVVSAADAVDRAAATVIQESLQRVGMHARLHPYANSVLYAPAAAGGIYFDGKFDIAVTGWYGGLDPETSEPWICANRAPNGPNLARWCDARYDAAFADQERAVDPAQRARNFHELQQRVFDEIPDVFTVYRTEYEALNPSLHGVAPNMLYNFGQTQDWAL